MPTRVLRQHSEI